MSTVTNGVLHFRFGYAAFTLMAIGIVGGFSVCTWYLCEANYSDVRPGPAGIVKCTHTV